MSTHIADKLMPYMANLLLVQVILLCATVLVGCIWWLRRHFQKQPFEGMSQFDHEKIAHEIQDEIIRLRELRNRIYPLGQTPVEDDDKFLSTPREPSAPVNTVPVDTSALEAKFAADFEARAQQLNSRIAELEAELEATKESKAVPAPASSGQLEQLQKEFHKDREVLKEQVVHLEKVLAEYKIFEEDFALARRYKAENDQLRKQLSETHNITEDDIASLFKSANPSDVGAKELFGASDLADLANDKISGAEENASPATDELMAALTSSSESSTPEPMQAAEPSGESALESTTESTSEPMVEATAETPVQAAPELAVETKTNNKDFEVEKTQEPELARAMKEGDIEDLAESAVNDDQLIAEFQKILGDQQT
jgi:hypothetical protein